MNLGRLAARVGPSLRVARIGPSARGATTDAAPRAATADAAPRAASGAHGEDSELARVERRVNEVGAGAQSVHATRCSMSEADATFNICDGRLDHITSCNVLGAQG
jgi:hypothetical protein